MSIWLDIIIVNYIDSLGVKFYLDYSRVPVQKTRASIQKCYTVVPNDVIFQS